MGLLLGSPGSADKLGVYVAFRRHASDSNYVPVARVSQPAQPWSPDTGSAMVTPDPEVYVKHEAILILPLDL